MNDLVRDTVLNDIKDPYNFEIVLASNVTLKQIMFCRHYLIDLNGTQAAIRTGYSRHSARWIAYELRCKPHIRIYIRELRDRLIERINNWPKGSCYRGNWRGLDNVVKG